MKAQACKAMLPFCCLSPIAACSTPPETALPEIALAAAKDRPVVNREEQVPEPPKPVEPITFDPIITNPGFEDDWIGWVEVPEGGDLIAISQHAHMGSQSAKVTDNEGRFEQTITVQPGIDYEVSAFTRGSGKIGIELRDETISTYMEGSEDLWHPIRLSFNSGSSEEVIIYGAYKEGDVRFDDFTITPIRTN